MPIKILRSSSFGLTTEFENSVSGLVDEGWSIVSVVAQNQGEQYGDTLVFVLKQKVQKDIVAAQSVPLEEVEKYVSVGWTVEQLYAKTATVIKTSQKTNGLENLAEAEETEA